MSGNFTVPREWSPVKSHQVIRRTKLFVDSCRLCLCDDIVSGGVGGRSAGMGDSRQYTGVAAVAAATRARTGRPRVGTRTESTGDIAAVKQSTVCSLLGLYRIGD